MNDWDDLLLTGGFAPRAELLRSLTVEQVGVRPYGVPHSIYQELWHAATAQKLMLDRGRATLNRWAYAEHFPEATTPASQGEGDELVEMFLTYSERAVHLAEDEAWLASPEPDMAAASTWRDGLEFLAVHNAYHMGKIVLLRQLMGIWPPAQ